MSDTTFDTARRPRHDPDEGGVLGPLLIALVHGLRRMLRSSPRPARNSDREMYREIARVRALAQHHRNTDRGFASDLLAAADRHEDQVRARRPGSAADRR